MSEYLWLKDNIRKLEKRINKREYTPKLYDIEKDLNKLKKRLKELEKENKNDTSNNEKRNSST